MKSSQFATLSWSYQFSQLFTVENTDLGDGTDHVHEYSTMINHGFTRLDKTEF